MFATQGGLQQLSTAKRVFIDGTYGICPHPQYTKRHGQVTALNTLFGVVGDEALYTCVVVISVVLLHLIATILA